MKGCAGREQICLLLLQPTAKSEPKEHTDCFLTVEEMAHQGKDVEGLAGYLWETCLENMLRYCIITQ